MATDRVSRPGATSTPATATPTASRPPAAAPAPTPAPPAPDRFGAPAPDRAGQAKRLGSPSRPDTEWWAGRPLSEARNAHRTNTKEQFEDARNSNANWFEGDVRQEINSDDLEMRHDKAHESGDNLTLREWLEAGVKTGRGLKLDIKEPEHMREVMDTLEEVGVPQERLMLNLGYGAFEAWGQEIRRRFPDAILALNPPTDGTIGKAEAEQLVAQAQRLGGPVTFVARYDQLSDEAIRILGPQGPVSVWGSGVDDVSATTEQLRRRGVDGMIDLSSHSPGLGDAVDAGKNWVKTKLDEIF